MYKSLAPQESISISTEWIYLSLALLESPLQQPKPLFFAFVCELLLYLLRHWNPWLLLYSSPPGLEHDLCLVSGTNQNFPSATLSVEKTQPATEKKKNIYIYIYISCYYLCRRIDIKFVFFDFDFGFYGR